MSITAVPLGVSPRSTSFVYDEKKPTVETEYLSYQITRILSHLSSAGFRFLVSDELTESSVNAQEVIDNWLHDWRQWLTETSDGVGKFLSEKEGSRGAFLVAAAPMLPMLPEILPAIGLGLALKVCTDIVSNVTETYAHFQQTTRANRIERVLDEALNEDTYFGFGEEKSYLRSIKEQLEKLNEKLETDGANGKKGLADISKDALTQILLEVVIDRANTLESVTFEGIKSQQTESKTA